MKTTIRRPISRRLIHSVTAISFLLILQSCSNKVAFNTSTVVPTAEGSVKVNRDNNSNYSIDIHIKHLASPDRLVPAKTTYVVWAETQDGTKNIGQLKTSSSLLSSTYKSSLKTVTPFKPTMIFITAENEATIQFPGSQVVMSTNNF
jgi:hypothetical protein